MFENKNHDNETEHPDLITELEMDQAPPSFAHQEVDNRHQFDDAGFKYENRHRLIISLVVFVLLGAALGYYLMFTPAGRELLDRSQQTTSSTSSDNNFPVSFASRSAKPNPIKVRDFSEVEAAADVAAAALADLNIAITEYADGEAVYPKFDPEVETGTPAASGQSSSSRSTSSSSSSR